MFGRQEFALFHVKASFIVCLPFMKTGATEGFALGQVLAKGAAGSLHVDDIVVHCCL